jgi:hypothetical protein
LNRYCEGVGAFVGPAEERIGFSSQAYADDVILIAGKPERVQRMLEILEDFTNWTQMQGNVKKCATASSLRDENRRRCSLNEEPTFKGQGLTNLTLGQSLKYLGTALAAQRSVKPEAVETKLGEMRVRLKKVMESSLSIVRKIDAIKTFLLLLIDLMLLNGFVGESRLKDFDQHIRRPIDEALKVRGLPVRCHHASWRDGGMSYPSLVDRRRVLMIRSFGQMILSKEKKIREAMRWFVNDERDYRKIAIDPGSTFLDWKDEHGRRGTAALVVRTRKSCKKMKGKMKLMKAEVVLRNSESESASEYKTKTAVGIGRFPTQKILRPHKINQLIEHKCHGASFPTLKCNEVSNSLLTDVHTRRTDPFFRFMVVGRANCLPKLTNLQRSYPNQPLENCRRCCEEKNQHSHTS